MCKRCMFSSWVSGSPKAFKCRESKSCITALVTHVQAAAHDVPSFERCLHSVAARKFRVLTEQLGSLGFDHLACMAAISLIGADLHRCVGWLLEGSMDGQDPAAIGEDRDSQYTGVAGFNHTLSCAVSARSAPNLQQELRSSLLFTDRLCVRPGSLPMPDLCVDEELAQLHTLLSAFGLPPHVLENLVIECDGDLQVGQFLRTFPVECFQIGAKNALDHFLSSCCLFIPLSGGSGRADEACSIAGGAREGC